MNNLALSIPRPVQSSSSDVSKRFRWWHEAIIDDMLTYPTDTLKERGARLKYSETYLSLLINSDMFQLFYQQRKAVHCELLHTSLTEKAGKVAGMGLDLMLESMTAKRTAIPFAVLSDTVNKTLATLGYGAVAAPAAVVNVNTNNVSVTPPVTREQLADARAKLLEHEAARATDVTPSAFGRPSMLSHSSEAVDAPRLAPGK